MEEQSGLHFDINFVPVERPGDGPVKYNGAQRIEQGAVVGVDGNIPADMFIKPAEYSSVDRFAIGCQVVCPPEQSHHPGPESAEEKDEERVFAEDVEEAGEGAAPAAEFNEVEEYGQDEHCQPGSIEYVGAGPYFFIDGEDHVPAEAGEDEYTSQYEEAAAAFERFSFLDDIYAGEVAEDDLGDGGQGAHESFRVESQSFPFVHMGDTEDGFVDVCTEPAGEAVGISRVGDQAEGPVAEQDDGGGQESTAEFKKVDDEGGKEIANGDALQYAEDPDAGLGVVGADPVAEGQVIAVPANEW